MDDRELLDGLRAGDHAAFDAIFRAWYAPLVRLAEGLLRDAGAAEEVVQDVMLELWRRRATLDPEGTAQAYLFQATRNRALNRLRHARVVDRTAPAVAGERAAVGSAGPPPDAEVAVSELEAAARAAIAGLPPRCREVFTLSREQGLTYVEIARALDVSVKAVEAQMGRALRTLRERLAPFLPGGERL